MEKILTVRDVADILQVKEITVREMFREGRLRGFKMGKAWRTTEDMLRADIETLAAGGTPGDGEATAATSAKKVRAKRTAKRPASRKKAAGASDAPAVEAPPPQPPAREAADGDADEDEGEDDAQGLLF